MPRRQGNSANCFRKWGLYGIEKGLTSVKGIAMSRAIAGLFPQGSVTETTFLLVKASA